MDIVVNSVLVGGMIAGALLLPFIVLGIYRHVEGGLVVMCLVVFLEMAFRQPLGINMGISLYPGDFAAGLITLAAAARIAFARPLVRPSWTWIGFGIVLMLSFVLGAGRFGTAAGVQYRGYYYSWIGALYAMTFRYDAAVVRRSLTVVLALAAWVELAVLLQFLARATGIVLIAPLIDVGDPDTLRVIRAEEAIFIADAIIITVFFAPLGRVVGYLRSLNWLWIPSLIVLQHRSVWLAAMGGIATAMGLQRGQRMRLQPARVALGASMVAVILVAALFSGRGAATLASALGESARRGVMLEDTASWRMDGWRQLLDRWSSGGPDVIAVGLPFGSDMSRYIKFGAAEVRVAVAAHNAYIQTLYNSGVIGLGLFLVFVAHLVVALLRLSKVEACRMPCNALLALLACQLLYYIPYGIVPLQILLMGIAYGYVHSNRAGPGAVGASPAAAGGPQP
jgi:hypothetical protein